MVASIQIIKSIDSIDGADNIVLAKFQHIAWQVVVKKGEFQPGDRAVYIEIDSEVEDRPCYEFLRNKQFRVKSVKLRKILSQGLALPLVVFGDQLNGMEIGADVSVIVGAAHYEKPVPAQLAGQVKGNFPTYLGISRTDEERVQNYPELIEQFQGQAVYISQKINGCSGSFIKHDGELRVCSRNLELKFDSENTFWKIAEKYKLYDLPDGYAVQGEIAGPGIQGNQLGLKEIELFVFNFFDLESKQYVHLLDLALCLEASACILPVVPIVYAGIFNFKSLDELLDFANQQRYPNGALAEGIVVRLAKETYNETLKGRSSFKVISNNFLLKHGE